MGNHALALLAALNTACRNVDELGQAPAELFQTHPDYAIIASSRVWLPRPAPACSPKSRITAYDSPMPEH
jgi:hypothetical protein